jgi:hypothetical protein
VLLHHAKAKVTHPDAPVTLLLAHAVELYLKAFLRLRGVGIEEVKNSFGHDFKKLVDEASSRGLSLGSVKTETKPATNGALSLCLLPMLFQPHDSGSRRKFAHCPLHYRQSAQARRSLRIMFR